MPRKMTTMVQINIFKFSFLVWKVSYSYANLTAICSQRVQLFINKPALVQKMAWHQPGSRPLSEPMVSWFTVVYSLGLCQTYYRLSIEWYILKYIVHNYCKISNISCTKSQNLNDSHLVLQLVFVQFIEARCKVENEDKVGAAPTGNAPAISEWSTT